MSLPGTGADLPSAVLFACQMNAVRSPMASAIMRHLTAYQVYAVSAGVHAEPTDPFAIAVMKEIGLDISGHVPVTISDLDDMSFDLVVTLAPEAHHQVLEFTRTMAFEVEYWPTIDPSLTLGSREQLLDAYRACRDQLFERIRKRFALGGAPGV